jgi:hypothetical protein
MDFSAAVADKVNFWVRFIDLAVEHPPLPSEDVIGRADAALMQAMVPDVRELYPIVYDLYSGDLAQIFRNPVYALSEPGVWPYYQTISHPMSLRDVIEKLHSSRYSTCKQVIDDVDLIWSNCATFNGADSTVTQNAKKCQHWFQKKVQDLEETKLVPETELLEFTEFVENHGDENLVRQLTAVVQKYAPHLVDAEESVMMELVPRGLFRRMQDTVKAFKSRHFM